ncbi:pseudouridine synthase [Glaciecola sp. SC05]|uniref:pseudouridine synthase n=1 Tax=Glaciecola sp. SC05 TaxID=1987355 RepID=UPI0035272DA7
MDGPSIDTCAADDSVQRPLIPILFQDEHLVIVHKPSGLLVHRSPIDKHETAFLLQRLRDQIGQYVYSVHRLDKPTSGLIVMALSPQIARLLSELFENQQVKKTYIALVRGYLNESITVDYPLVEQLDKMTDRMDKQNEAKPAVTDIEPLACFELPFPVARYQSGRFSLLKLHPRTGRKHQLRRHLAHLRHPIIGDTSHGDGKQNKYAVAHMNIHRLALCATGIEFIHPVSGVNLVINTKLDQDLAGIAQLLDNFSTTKRAEFDWQNLI